MGFNIGISGFSNSEIEIECDKFIDRKYYFWVNEYELLGKKSCLHALADFIKLDLIPLTNFIFDEDIESKPTNMQNIDFLLTLTTSLLAKTDGKFDIFIENLPAELKDKWKNYFLNGEFTENIKTLKESLNCFKSNGFQEVYFYV